MNALNQAIHSRLSSGTALAASVATVVGGTAPALFHLQAPDNQALPYVVWSWAGGGQTPDHDIINRLEFVRAYGTTPVQAGSIYGLFDALLNGSPLTVTGWTNIGLRGEDDVELVETPPNGGHIYTVGRYYRTYLDK